MTSSMGKMWDEVPYQPIATSTIQYISRVLHTSSTALLRHNKPPPRINLQPTTHPRLPLLLLLKALRKRILILRLLIPTKYLLEIMTRAGDAV